MSGLPSYTAEDGTSRIELRANGKRYRTTIVEFRLPREAAMRPSLTFQNIAKPRSSAEDSSVVQVVNNGQMICHVKVGDRGFARRRLPSSAGN